MIEGINRTETVEVQARNGETFEVEIRPLSEVALVGIAEKNGLDLQELEKQTGKALQKMQFMDQIVAAALVEAPEQKLDADALANAVHARERAKIFRKVLDLSGYGAKAVEQVEKFPGEPTQQAA